MYDRYEMSRARFQAYAFQKLQKSRQDLSLLTDSDNYRYKHEAKQLCDLGTSITEKYGDTTGWKMKLRHDFDKVQEYDGPEKQLLETELSVGVGGIFAIAKDDRGKRIDIIRKTIQTPELEITEY